MSPASPLTLLQAVLFTTAFTSSTSSSVGVDLSVATNSSTWRCVLDELGDPSSTTPPPFAVVRVYRNLGEVKRILLSLVLNIVCIVCIVCILMLLMIH